MSKPMPILDYINRMNQIYGNEPAPVRYNTQQYLQGGRVGYKPGGIVEPGVTHYGKKTGFAINPEGQIKGTKVAKEIADVKKVKVVGHLKELEQWIETNASKYTDVDKFYKDALEKFDKPKYEGLVRESVQKAQKNVRGPVKAGKHIYIPTPYGQNVPQGSRYNYKNLFELKGVDAGSKIRYVKDMMLINMLEKNPKMIKFAKNLDKVVLNDFKDLSDTDRRLVGQFTNKHLKATVDRPNLFRSYLNERHKGFEELRKERTKYSKGVEADLQNKLKNPNIGDAAKKKIRNTLDNIYKTKKYHIDFKTEFPDLFVDKPVKDPKITTGQEQFHFEHGISKGSTAINKLPETYNLRGRYMPSSFNYAKMINFDTPLVNFMRKYRETKDPKLEKQITKLVNKFNKQSAGYLDNLTVNFDRSTGSVIVDDKTPMYKVKDFADYKAQMAKNLKHSQAYLKTVEGGKYAFDEKKLESFLQTAKNVKGPKKIQAVTKMIALLGSGKLADEYLKKQGISLTQDENEKVLEASMLPTELIQEHPITSAAVAGTTLRASKSVKGDPLKKVRRLHKLVSTPLKKLIRTAGTPLAGAGFAGWQIHDNLKAGESVADAVVDPIVGAELAFPSLFKENISKIIPDKYQGKLAKAGRKVLGLGKVGSRFMGPVGIGIGAVGSVYDAYKDYERRKEFLTPERIAEAQEEEFDKEEPMFAMGGIASLIK